MRDIPRSVRVAMRCDVVSAAGPGRLVSAAGAGRPDGGCLPPRRAYSLAAVVVDGDGGGGRFVSGAGLSFAAEAIARCAAGWPHPIPAPRCRCGFAATSLDNLLVVAGPPVLQPGRASAVLEVELGGRELEGPRAYRAAQQRVLAAAFVPVCHCCVAEEGRLVPAVALGGFAPAPPKRVFAIAPVCDVHGRALGSGRVWSLATVTGLVGAEVSWAGPPVIEAVFPQAARPPRPSGSGTPVSRLSMGQVGYVAPTAVQVSADGSVWVDGTALAPSRGRRRDRLAVRRMADLRALRLEVWSRGLGVHGRIPSPSPLSDRPSPDMIPVAAVHADCGCSPQVPCDLSPA